MCYCQRGSRLLLLTMIVSCIGQFAIGGESLQSEKSDPSPRSTSSPRLILPPSIPAVVGMECNLYFDNVVLTARSGSLLFDAVCGKGRQQEERWTWLPTESDIGSHSLEVIVRDEHNNKLASATCSIDVVSAKQGEHSAMSLLAIGDSLTHPSFYLRRVLDQCETFSGPKLRLVGSHIPQPGSPGLRHEGYGGWTARRFATFFTETKTTDHTKRGSPFLFKNGTDAPRLDFAAYCREFNNEKYPDVVTIFLGPNDIFSLDDERIEAGVNDSLNHFELLMKMVWDVSPSTRIALLLPIPPCSSQDGFGANYASGQTRWQYRRNQHRFVERMLERYASRSAEKSSTQRLSLVPTYLSFDCVHNYPTELVPANSTTDVKVSRQSNGLHPAASGHAQIGDTLFAWLKSQANE